MQVKLSYGSFFLLYYTDALNNFTMIDQLSTACSKLVFDRDNCTVCSNTCSTQVYFDFEINYKLTTNLEQSECGK